MTMIIQDIFLDNKELIKDLKTLTKNEFRHKHWYITDLQYQINHDLFYSKKENKKSI